MKLKERYLILLLIMILSAIVIVAYGGNWLEDKRKDIRTIEKQTRDKQEELNAATILNEQLGNVRQAVINSIVTEADSDSLNERSIVKDGRKIGFTSQEINQFQRLLAEFADSLNITVKATSQKPEYSPATILEHEFTISFEATYEQMGKYIAMLEKMDKIISINTFDVDPIRNESEEIIDPETGESPPTRYRVYLEVSLFKIRKKGA